MYDIATARSKYVAKVTDLWRVLAKIDTMSLFCALAFNNGWEYSNAV